MAVCGQGGWGVTCSPSQICALKGSTVKISCNYSYPPNPPKYSSVSVSPSGPVEEGKPLFLTCSSDANPAPAYTLYKDSKLLSWSKDVYSVPSSTSKDRGNYLCLSENHYGQLKSSSIFVDVFYGPKLPSVSVSPSGDIVEGSSVTLTCSSDANPAANYTWYKESDHRPVGVNRQLIFSSIKRSESGLYVCKAFNYRGGNVSDGVKIDVIYAPDLPSVLMSPSDGIMEGSSVTLTCSSDANPAAKYTWYKQGENSSKASGENFTINNIKHDHSGNYYCRVENRIGHKNATLQVAVVAGQK
ncbi:B-cell receptor CD22-like [Austrofundulus limnaeus]|uniref:B-cell receptor CD22-like n=1 Tax=Austrofundulus limnaeus TaxID=52670 RepID=A0A2I4C3U4_AUSLI|nr:PREDICTED: B-cell receptor CD22-like [Austrofundulus limnaeus]